MGRGRFGRGGVPTEGCSRGFRESDTWRVCRLRSKLLAGRVREYLGGCEEGTYSFAEFLDCLVAVCFACGMRAEEQGLWLAVVEADKTMLPVADVVAESHVEYHVS